jgi:hypothetical protein
MRDETSATKGEDGVDAVGRKGPRTTLVSEETWAEIRAVYLAGATAKEIQRRWGVAPKTVYARAVEGGWTKRQAGDAAARARAQEHYAGDIACKASIAAHFLEDDGTLDQDAADMGTRALLASATAMQHGEVAQARALVAMAEGYYRIVPRQRSRMLWYMMDVLSHEGTADDLFEKSIKDDTHPIKLRYRGWKEERALREQARDGEILRLKRKLKQVEQELESERKAHMADAAQLFAAWEREPLEEHEEGSTGTSDAAPRS